MWRTIHVRSAPTARLSALIQAAPQSPARTVVAEPMIPGGRPAVGVSFGTRAVSTAKTKPSSACSRQLSGTAVRSATRKKPLQSRLPSAKHPLAAVDRCLSSSGDTRTADAAHDANAPAPSSEEAAQKWRRKPGGHAGRKRADSPANARITVVRALSKLVRDVDMLDYNTAAKAGTLLVARDRIQELAPYLPTDVAIDTHEIIESMEKIRASETDLDYVHRRRLRQLRKVVGEDFVDMNDLWKSYQLVREAPDTLQCLPPFMFRLVRSALLRGMQELGVAETARRILVLFCDQQTAGHPYATNDHIAHMWALSELGRYGEVVDQFDQLRYQAHAEGRRLTDERIWHYRLVAMARLGLVNQAISAAKTMCRRLGKFPTGPTAAVLLVGIIRDGDIDRACRLLDLPTTRPTDPTLNKERLQLDILDSQYAYNVLVAELAKHQRFDAAQVLFNRMCSRGIKAMPFATSALVDAVGRSDQRTQTAVRAMYDSLYERESKLDVVSHSMSLHHLVRRGDPDAVRVVLARMRADGVVPNVYTFTTMIQGAAEADNMEAAEALFKQMHAYQIQPTTHTYVALLDGYARQRNLPAVQRVLQSLQSADLTIALPVWNTVLSAFARAGDLKGALHIFQQLRQAGQSPDRFTYWWMFYAYRWCRLPPRLERALGNGWQVDRRDHDADSFSLDPTNERWLRYADKAAKAAVREPANVDWTAYEPVDTAFLLCDTVLDLPQVLAEEMRARRVKVDIKLQFLRTMALRRVHALRAVTKVPSAMPQQYKQVP
ncbi:hypothetical protein THASP1DRAFT_29107 [Thamnocephalis sphaerospora]|uniref:PROP1-like PPR domain-containing protein n=1 Tax=Thamnocephalis sphaerospora TaxID=78915 RepID=A0A4V1IWX7_9FUNG|nr:hypothetical protein THASP1DRAFT_29107 [Thamnocephalis sphaerospora]|eukprot:RKP09099.1 hypothetical protein THASP1DRAFT_29107 [Thamnocephalis sphaerospora]